MNPTVKVLHTWTQFEKQFKLLEDKGRFKGCLKINEKEYEVEQENMEGLPLCLSPEKIYGYLSNTHFHSALLSDGMYKIYLNLGLNGGGKLKKIGVCLEWGGWTIDKIPPKTIPFQHLGKPIETLGSFCIAIDNWWEQKSDSKPSSENPKEIKKPKEKPLATNAEKPVVGVSSSNEKSTSNIVKPRSKL